LWLSNRLWFSNFLWLRSLLWFSNLLWLSNLLRFSNLQWFGKFLWFRVGSGVHSIHISTSPRTQHYADVPSSSLYLANSSGVHDYLKKLGVTLVAANSPDQFLVDRPID
jgi:hypothetical protein